MNENRRDFMKTLGKLGAALGITAAVATSAKPDITPEFIEKAEHELENRASLEPTSNFMNGGKSFPDTLEPAFKKKVKEYEFGFTGFRSFEENAQLQKDVDLVYNQIIDNKHMEMMPPMMAVPPHVYDFVMKKQAIADLDPFNWGAVFDVKWIDWRPKDPRFDTFSGTWEVTVKPRYQSIFTERYIYREDVQLPMRYLESCVPELEATRVKNLAKSRAYDSMVDALRGAIQTVIDLDKKLNPPAPTGVRRHHISNRDKADLSGITK